LKQSKESKSDSQDKLRKESQEKELALRFSPTAWAKLLYFRDKSDNEVGGFGITESDDLLFVTDFQIVKQKVTGVSVSFDDNAVADFFDQQVDIGKKPEQFARIWCHTHPGMSAEPSITDENTFQRVFGQCQWALMFILADGREVYARLSFNIGPGGQILIPVKVDYGCDFGPSDKEVWDAEYAANIEVENFTTIFGSTNQADNEDTFSDLALPYDFIDEFEQMDPCERQFVLDELAARPESYDDYQEDMYL